MNLRNEWWKWIFLFVCSSSFVHADDEPVVIQDQLLVLNEVNAAVTALQEAQTPKYWLGLLCIDVGESLRSQLGLEEGAGLLIDAVTEGTPAKEAGLQRHDVLIVAQPASQPLTESTKKLASPKDLVDAVQAAETKPLRLVLFRQGQRKEIEVAPVERNKSDPVKTEFKLTFDHEQLNPSHQELQLRLAGPVFAYQTKAPAVPEGMTIEFRQIVGQAEKILITKGDEKWDVTEPEIGNLPEPVRVEVLKQIVARRSAPVPLILANPATPPVAPIPPIGVASKPFVHEYTARINDVARANERSTKTLLKALNITSLPAGGNNTTVTATTKLTDDLTVTVTRKGSEPARITVKKGEQSWESGEKGFDQLPEDVRAAMVSALPNHPHVAEVAARDAAIQAKKKAELAADWISKAESQRSEAIHRTLDAQRKLKDEEMVTLREVMEKSRREMREERESLKQQKEELIRQTKELHESIDKLRQRLDKIERN